jgi:GNAT superfamily N-acetyltransferase
MPELTHSDRPHSPPGPGIGLPDLLVRPAMPADTEGVTRLLARSYRALLAADYDPALLREALPLISVARPSLLSCGTYFVVEQDDRILAAGGWTDLSPHGAPGRAGVGHVRHVAVDPACARTGLGSLLMRRVLCSARAAGVVDLRCQSTLTAVPFYSSLGFETVGRIEVRLPTGVHFPAVQMRREEG